MRELPLACTLGPAELRERTAAMSRVGAASLVSASAEGRHAELRFRSQAAPDVAAIVAAETECCAFLAMDLRAHGDELVLRVDAPEGAEPVLDALVAAFSAGR